MAYSLPAFPLLANIWRNGNPTTNPPDVVAPANLAYGKRTITQFWDWGSPAPPVGASIFSLLLFPPFTDIRDGFSASAQDTVEFPAGTGRFYQCDFVDDFGKGFPNEHRFSILEKIGVWPSPIP